MITRATLPRYELKYVVSERCALALRRYVHASLPPDAHGLRGNEIPSYEINSLYLDSRDLRLCYGTLDGLRDRYKFRLRYYDDAPDRTVFFEIKHRRDRCIRKDRAAVRGDAVPRLLRTGAARPDDLRPGADGGALARFMSLAAEIGARGTALVSYEREAYAAPDNHVRVTFDRNLRVRRPDADDPLSRRHRPFHLRMGGVIVEIKFTGLFPGWLSDMVRIFSMSRRPVPKYVKCMQAIRTTDFEMMRRTEAMRRSE